MAIIVPSGYTAKPESAVVTLARYAQITQSDECAFWGVRYEGQERLDCGTIWSKVWRDNIAKYLLLAQEMIEQELSFPLMPRWIVGSFTDENPTDIYFDEQRFHHPTTARWGRFIEAGIRAEEDVETVALVYNTETPDGIATASVTTDIDENELFVFFPGTDVQVTPAAVSVSSGVVTFTFPRCRLVAPQFSDNPSSGWQITDNDVFETEVDIRRIYNDPSTNAIFVGGRCNSCGSTGCVSATQTGCIRPINQKLGILEIKQATYTNGAWSYTNNSCGRNYEMVRLYYKAGLTRLPSGMEDAIVRLAHTLMPDEPCGCEYGQRMWRRDRTVPEIVTPQRLNCPFGTSDGAWFAWLRTQRQRIMKVSVL